LRLAILHQDASVFSRRGKLGTRKKEETIPRFGAYTTTVDAGVVLELLQGAGVYRPPCVCCSQRPEKTCKFTVENVTINCDGYVPVSAPRGLMQEKILRFINVVGRIEARKKLLRPKLAAMPSQALQFARSE
jgi:hypothetical protein